VVLLKKKADLASLLSNLQTHDILFIDEIHRLPIQVEEILYSAMEDFRLDILVGQGFNATTLKIDLNPFTLIGATTKAGSLSHPLRDRFGAHLHFDFYEEAELVEMLRLHSKRQKLPIDHQALKVMAECSRGTPRIALRLFRRLIDYCCVEKKSLAGIHEVRCCLKLLEIEENGLVRLDRQILEVMDKQFRGGPVGIESLCACLNEDRETIEIVYEPFLLKRGFIARTGKGRVLTEIGKKFLI
jgi:Holliday junction DNA helicase RuvB